MVNEATEPPAKAAKAARLSNNEQIALACLDKAKEAELILATVGEDHAERPVVTEEAWRRWFYAEGKPGESPEIKRQAFVRAKDGLLAKGWVVAREDYVWRPDTW